MGAPFRAAVRRPRHPTRCQRVRHDVTVPNYSIYTCDKLEYVFRAFEPPAKADARLKRSAIDIHGGGWAARSRRGRCGAVARSGERRRRRRRPGLRAAPGAVPAARTSLLGDPSVRQLCSGKGGVTSVTRRTYIVKTTVSYEGLQASDKATGTKAHGGSTARGERRGAGGRQPPRSAGPGAGFFPLGFPPLPSFRPSLAAAGGTAERCARHGDKLMVFTAAAKETDNNEVKILYRMC